MKELGWTCAAYEHEKSSLCFFDEIQGLPCDGLATCEQRLQVWQGRLYQQIRTLAATGDSLWQGMADGIVGIGDVWDVP